MAMPQAVPWTRADLDRLPEDGNRYEVLDGALLVTPAPSPVHQRFVDWLNERLHPFVFGRGLGVIHFPRAVIVVGGSQLEPDMIVRAASRFETWEEAPVPMLVVEVTSGSTRRRDLGKKRDFYMSSGVVEYWAVDRWTRAVLRFTPAGEERIDRILRWHPPGTTTTLDLDVAAMFNEVLGPA